MDMNRRHFMQHVAGASALAGPSIGFIRSLKAAEENLKKQGKSLVIFWMGGGPSHMDLWDLKPGAQTGGEFKPIKTNASGIEISEVLPTIAQNFKNLSTMFVGRWTLWDRGICDHEHELLELLYPSRNHTLGRISCLKFTIMK